MLHLKHEGKTKVEKIVKCYPWCSTHTNIFPCKTFPGYFSHVWLTFAFWQIMVAASHFAILHQCNLFCHPALIHAYDPYFTLRLGSNKAESLSSWVRRDGSFHRAALSFPFFTQAMTDKCNMQNALYYRLAQERRSYP